MAADLAAATYAEIATKAIIDGDWPRAVGAIAAIDEKAWTMLRERIPGFPAVRAEDMTAALELPRSHAAIEIGPATRDVFDDEPDWATLGTHTR